jgi:regulator of PEP synthase PpsR (kinase-PPPase family)
MSKSRDIYYVSGSTGILAKNMGQALLAQFSGINFVEEFFPFIRTIDEAEEVLQKILKQSQGRHPIVFSTLFVEELNDVFKTPEIHFFNICDEFLDILEHLLDEKALRVPGSSRQHDDMIMSKRVNAIHFTISHDDGISMKDYDEADLILVGVSRTGKTPVSVYLATQMGLKTANYPLVEENLNKLYLPPEVLRNRGHVAAISTSAQMLHDFRESRYKGSRYAQFATCVWELEQARKICLKHDIPMIVSDGRSIEETATQIIQDLQFKVATRF